MFGWKRGFAPPKGIKAPIFLKIASLFKMPPKSSDVHDKITVLRCKIDKKKAEKERATNLRQKDIKQKKIDEWIDEIISLQESIHRKWEEPLKKKRRVYIEDPDLD